MGTLQDKILMIPKSDSQHSASMQHFEATSMNAVLAALNADQMLALADDKNINNNQQHDQHLQTDESQAQQPANQGAGNESAQQSNQTEGNDNRHPQNKDLGVEHPPHVNENQDNNTVPNTTQEVENLARPESGESSQSSMEVPLTYIQIDGHAEDLPYDPYGLPYIVLSVPRDLGIPPFPPALEKVYLPVEIPPAPTVAPEVGPCCIDPISIDVKASDPEGAYFFESLLRPAFSFTFESFCSAGYSEVVFTPNPAGIANLEAQGSPILESPSENSDPTATSYVIPILDDPDCVSQLASCDNPIVCVAISLSDLTGSTHYNFDTLNDFSSFPSNSSGAFVEFLSNTDAYELVSNNDGSFALVPVNCLEDSTSPIVLDLNNSGFELTAASTSNVLLNHNGTTVQSGWVGPDNGFLTYNYSGSGPIANNNFILTQNVPGAKTDFQALEILAGQHGGIIDASNPIFSKLGVWQDSNQNGVMDKGEYHTLSQLGIVSIGLTESGPLQLINGNLINGVMTFTYANGTTGKAADVALNYHDIVQSNNSIPGVSNNAPVASSVAVATPAVTPVHVDPVVQAAIDTTQHVATTAHS